MRLLLTGASSFTGYWFAKTLAEAGHEVVAVYTRSNADAYGDSVRGERVRLLAPLTTPLFDCRFGDEKFVATIRDRTPDIVCHHGADATNYKSPDFDVGGAVASNALGLVDVLRAARDCGGGRLLLTGSVFEGGEGIGSDGLPHFSPYGLSKSLTAQLFQFYGHREGIALGKLVISNPFGPYEEPRFTTYLARSWQRGETPSVQTPAYIRDNIHVTLLARAYAAFVERLPRQPGYTRYNPSGYVESQGAFAERFARELASRLQIPCPLAIGEQTTFAEPRMRINADSLSASELGWNETSAWNELAAWYESHVSR